MQMKMVNGYVLGLLVQTEMFTKNGIKLLMEKCLKENNTQGFTINLNK